MSIHIEYLDYDLFSPRKLGRHVEHDSRSLMYRVRDNLGLAGWRQVLHTGAAPILDQGSLGACTGYAAAGAASYIENDSELLPSTPGGWDRLAQGLYHDATNLDSIRGTWPPEDTGSTGLAAAKAVVHDELASGYLHALTEAELAAALNKGPVMVGTQWYRSMFDTNRYGDVDIDYESGLAGGHEYVLDEYRPSTDQFGFRNSWGTGFGLGGRFYVQRGDYLDLLFNRGGDAISLVPAVEPAPGPTPPPEPEPAGCLPGSKLLARWFAC